MTHPSELAVNDVAGMEILETFCNIGELVQKVSSDSGTAAVHSQDRLGLCWGSC